MTGIPSRNIGTTGAFSWALSFVFLFPSSCAAPHRLPPRPPAEALPVSAGVEGAWLNPGGVATSYFADGALSSVAADTGNTIGEGTYWFDGDVIEIALWSLLRQQQMRVACLLSPADLLNCTDHTGLRFSLMRVNG